jgi:putative heme-binding domain-containing protein
MQGLPPLSHQMFDLSRRPGRIRPGLALVLAGLASCLHAGNPSRETLEKFRDPQVQSYGHYVAVRLPLVGGVSPWNPTVICFSKGGSAFAANQTGEVYQLVDSDGDGLEDTARLFCDVRRDGFRTVTSLGFLGDEVLVGTDSAVRAYRDADGDRVAEQGRTLLKFPANGGPYDWIFGLCTGPDGNLYAALPTDSYSLDPSDDPGGWRGSLLSITPDGSRVEVVASGLRYPYGLAFTGDGELFFTDNEGGGNPTEELNRLVPGAFYGHNPRKFGRPGKTQPPMVALREGRGSTGLAWNTTTNDFDRSGGCLFVALWGKDLFWSEGTVSRIRLQTLPDGTRAAREEVVLRQIPKPTGLAFGPGGDLYVASYGVGGWNNSPGDRPSGGFYRIFHVGWAAPDVPPHSPRLASRGNMERGGILFTNLGCANCHLGSMAVEGLGPNLAGLGETFIRSQALLAITNPSASIRTGYEAFRIELKDAEPILGWLVTSTPLSLNVQVASGQAVELSRDRILSVTRQRESLMPSALLENQTPEAVDDLMAFLGVPDDPVSTSSWSQRVEKGLGGFLPGRRTRTKLMVLVLLAGLAGLAARILWRTVRPRVPTS